MYLQPNWSDTDMGESTYAYFLGIHTQAIFIALTLELSSSVNAFTRKSAKQLHFYFFFY